MTIALAEREYWLPGISATPTKRSDKYCGATLCRHLYAMTHSRSVTSSQWRPMASDAQQTAVKLPRVGDNSCDSLSVVVFGALASSELQWSTLVPVVRNACTNVATGSSSSERRVQRNMAHHHHHRHHNSFIEKLSNATQAKYKYKKQGNRTSLKD